MTSPHVNPSERGIRLQKRLAHLGVASRRQSEALITAGRVAINGQVVTELGTRALPTDAITVDGNPVISPAEALGTAPGAPIVLALHKPMGIICARHDPQGRPTIYNLLPDDLPFFAHVGRLDFQTEGLLLLTNEGDLARALLRPDNAVPRVYDVKVRGRLSRQAIRRLDEGIPLDGRPTRPVAIERLPSKSKHDWIELTLFEGKHHHVRRILEAVGHPVTKLRRVAFGGIMLDGLRPGAWRVLDACEVTRLRDLASG